MKKMTLAQMELIEGGINCQNASLTASVFGYIGFGLGIAALTVSTGGLAAVILVSQATVFGGVGVLTDAGARLSGCR